MQTQIISDGSLTGELPAIPLWQLPAPDLFSRRAARLVRLANGHAMEGYLKFAAALCLAQQRVSDSEVGCESSAAMQALAAGPMPPRHEEVLGLPSWQLRFAALLDAMAEQALPDPARQTVRRLRELPSPQLAAAAEAILAGNYEYLDASAWPFVAAALQVHWLALVRAMPPLLSLPEEDCLCPFCRSVPQASLVRIGGAWQGLRYLTCSLCSTQWHYTRVKCGHCCSTQGINYLAIDGGSGAAKAETCDSCGSYTKIFHLDRDSELEVAADDLATLALDLMVDDAGYRRAGPNLLLHPG